MIGRRLLLHSIEVFALQLPITRDAEAFADGKNEGNHRVIALEIDP